MYIAINENKLTIQYNVSELTRGGATVSEELTRGPYVADRVGFKPATFRTQGTEPATKPNYRPILLCCIRGLKLRSQEDKTVSPGLHVLTAMPIFWLLIVGIDWLRNISYIYSILECLTQ